MVNESTQPSQKNDGQEENIDGVGDEKLKADKSSSVSASSLKTYSILICSFVLVIGTIGYGIFYIGKRLGYEGSDYTNILLPVILISFAVFLLFTLTNFLDQRNKFHKPSLGQSNSSSDQNYIANRNDAFFFVRAFVASIELLNSTFVKKETTIDRDDQEFLKALKDREEVTKSILGELQEKTKEYIVYNSFNEIKEQASYLAKEKSREQLFEKLSFRLEEEIASQSRRGVFNLSVGVMTAAVGIWFLYSLLTDYTESASYINLVSHFVPRVSLVILIEVFAYFFLNLYKRSLDEIKYFQNELTNVEMKYMALKVAVDSNNDKISENLIKVIVETERNRFLKKGETTVEIERAKIDQLNHSNAISKAYELLEKVTNKEKESK